MGQQKQPYTLKELAEDTSKIERVVTDWNFEAKGPQTSYMVMAALTLRLQTAIEGSAGKLANATDQHKAALNRASDSATYWARMLFYATCALVVTTVVLAAAILQDHGFWGYMVIVLLLAVCGALLWQARKWRPPVEASPDSTNGGQT